MQTVEPPSPAFVRTSEGRFAYLEAGPAEGPLVLCLHGFPDQPFSLWPLLLRLGQAGYRAVAPWMRGYAPSVLEGPYHGDQLAADVLALVDALGGPLGTGAQPCIVGHDWGAQATFFALARAPGLFRRAVVMAVPHPSAFFRALAEQPAQLRRSWYIFFFQLPGLPEAVLERGDYALIRRLWRDWSPSYRLSEAHWRALHACLKESMPAPLDYYRALLRPPGEALGRLRAQLTGEPIRDPVLHLHGEEDGCIAPSVRRGQERCFAGEFESRVLPGVGHFLALEDPDRVAEHVLEWLGPPR